MSAVAPLARDFDPRDGLRMVFNARESAQRLLELQAFIQEAMVEGVDYGVIPGTGAERAPQPGGQKVAKKTLLQPGAQKLAELYGLAHRFEFIESVKDWQNEFFYFEVRCVLVRRGDELFVGEGIGSCNSKESRHAHRWVDAAELPVEMDVSRLKKRSRQRWCFASELPKGIDRSTLRNQTRSRKDGSGDYLVYAVPGDTVDQYALPNDDICSVVNTLQKMACKRALVHAVLAVTRSAGIFTQDLEELPPEVYGVVEEVRPWERDREPTSAEPPAPATAAAPAPPPPEQVRDVPATAAAAPAGTVGPRDHAAPVAPKPEVTEVEARIMETCAPKFAACRTDAEFRGVCREALEASSGPTSSPAFKRWYETMKSEVRKRLSLPGSDTAGPVKAAAPRVSTARNEKAVRG